jgi:uncharacterized membrane protein YozB (DUF420 family)
MLFGIRILVVTLLGIFNAGAPFLSDLNLLFQVAIAAFLVLASFAMVRRKYVIHGVIMACCIVLNTISIFAIMVPSLLRLKGLISGLSTRLSLLVMTHAILGSVVEILGVLLVVAWVFNGTRIDNCFQRKYVMLATIILWILEIILGVYVYMTLYPFV